MLDTGECEAVVVDGEWDSSSGELKSKEEAVSVEFGDGELASGKFGPMPGSNMSCRGEIQPCPGAELKSLSAAAGACKRPSDGHCSLNPLHTSDVPSQPPGPACGS